LFDTAALPQIPEDWSLVLPVLDPAKLRERQDRDVEFPSEDLEAAGDITHLLRPVLRAPAPGWLEELEVVHHHESQWALPSCQAPRSGTYIEDRALRPVVDDEREVGETGARIRHGRSLVVPDIPPLETHGVNPTLSGEEATEHGGAWHLKRHVQHRPVAYRLPSDPASKGCLPHAGCGTDGNEIPDLEAADDRVQVWQAGRQADEFPLARPPLLECLVSELGHRGRVVMVIRPYRIEDAGLDAVKGFRYVVWQAERLILALLTGVDHLSETGVLGDDPSVVGHAAGGRDGGDKREQVRLAPELLQLTSTPQGVRQRHRVHWLALASKIHHEPEHLGMRRPV